MHMDERGRSTVGMHVTGVILLRPSIQSDFANLTLLLIVVGFNMVIRNTTPGGVAISPLQNVLPFFHGLGAPLP